MTYTTAASHLLLQRLKQPMSRTAKLSFQSCFHYNEVEKRRRENNEAKSSRAAETESCSFTHHQIHKNRQIFTKSFLKRGFLYKKKMPSIRCRTLFMVNIVAQERRECFWRSVMSCKSVASGTAEEIAAHAHSNYTSLLAAG